MNYLDLLQTYNLSLLQSISIGFAVFLLGLSRSGIKGVTIIVVLILAFIFGEKASTGILLPVLICGDIIAVIYYKRHVQWKYIKKLAPWMIIGVLVGVWIGNDISAFIFKKLMAIIIVISVLIMFYLESKTSKKIPENKLFSTIMGFLAGFSTMVGNLAGPIASIYFLALRFPKTQFIGTVAWLFFMVNLFKLPFHIFVWETISKETLALNLVLIPALILGFFSGTYLVKLISNINYRRFVLVVTAIGAIIMLIK